MQLIPWESALVFSGIGGARGVPPSHPSCRGEAEPQEGLPCGVHDDHLGGAANESQAPPGWTWTWQVGAGVPTWR